MANLSDVKNKPVATIMASRALGSSHPIADFSEAALKVNVDQRASDGGKYLGRVQIAGDADGANAPRMLIAHGGLATNSWSVTDALVATIVPAYTVANPAPTVGVGSDLKPNFNNTTHDDCGIASVPFPIVALADLQDLGNVVNYHEYSGKTRGAVVIVNLGASYDYAIATGGNPADGWVQSDGTALAVTGTIIPSTSTDAGDGKPVVQTVTSITSVDFPVIASADLVDAGYDALYSTVETSLVRLDETAVVRDGGGNNLALMYGLVDTGAVTWVDLGGAIADVVPA